MPKSLRDRLDQTRVLSERRRWAARVTDRWLAERKGTVEDIRNKPFNRDEMVALALIADQGDNIRAAELAAHGGHLPGPETWLPGPEFWFLLRALYREFGYVVGFLAHVRDEQAPGRGFTTPRGGITARHPNDTKNPGKVKATPKVIRGYMADPAFAARVNAHAKGAAPGMKDVEAVIKELGPFSFAESATGHATRKPAGDCCAFHSKKRSIEA